jgi:hypothetical protein
MQYSFDVWFAHQNGYYAAWTFVAESESAARALAEKHLEERKPFGFSEREIRSINPQRTPWVPGLKVVGVYNQGPHVEDDDRDEIPF